MMRCALPAACAAALCLPAGTWGATTTYQARPVCAAPAPGHAGCLALELVPAASGEPLRARAPLTRPLQARPAAPAATGQAGAAVPQYAVGQTPKPLYLAEVSAAYHLPTEPVAGSAPQTIALVDAYNDLNAEADLKTYSEALGLPECSEANGCFAKVNQNGEAAEAGASGTPFPKSQAELTEQENHCTAKQQAACEEVEEAKGWDIEISTDIDVAHSICRTCRILLVEAASSSFSDLEAAEKAATNLGATEISNSWGGPEPETASPAFEHAGTVITAAAGDDGYRNWTEAGEPSYFAEADYPASSRYVVAVGGTELTLAAGARKSETVWNEDPDPSGGNTGAGGSGCSALEPAPPWQLEMTDWASVGCGTGAAAKRAVADVAADADPYTGVLVYDSQESKSDLLAIGGTSVASPIVASAFALAGGAHGVAYPAQTLYYRHGRGGSPSLYDVAAGGNGECDDLYTGGCKGSLRSPLDCGAGELICNAAAGYDGPTGVGAPNGIAAFEPEGAQEHAQKVAAEQVAEEEQAAAAKKASEEQAAAEQKAAEERAAAEQAAQARQRAEAEAAAAQRAEEEREAAARRAAEEATALAGAAGGGSGAGAGTGQLAGASALGEVDLAKGIATTSAPHSTASGGGSGHATHHRPHRRRHRHPRRARRAQKCARSAAGPTARRARARAPQRPRPGCARRARPVRHGA